MTAVRMWWQGSRPRTLPAAIAPVLVGTAAATVEGGFTANRAVLSLVVALALQVGVNYANDYSDGIRGTDDARVGPVRLVGQRLATPTSVRNAALISFAVATAAGLALVVLSTAWWLILVGAASILAAWTYTGGPRPYGYAGLGEISVFVFFGVVAVVGTTFVQVERVSLVALLLSLSIGALAVAILVANNLRDISSDAEAGKRTLAVRLGPARTRHVYALLVAQAYAVTLLVGLGGAIWTSLPVGALAGLLSAPLAVPLVRAVRGGAAGPALIPVLGGTGRLLLVYATTVSAGLVAQYLIAGALT